MKRNGYIDFIKFFFAIMVAEFHLKSGIFLNGRLAVEGFFIISGFLMMKTIEKQNRASAELLQPSLARSTASFLWRKYVALFYYLIPAILVGFIVNSLHKQIGFVENLQRIPMLIFEVFPLRLLGVKGTFVLGVSWYFCAMFAALAILYPCCKKFKSGFSSFGCLMISAVCYGTLAHHYGHLALVGEYFANGLINVGIVRGVAGCSLGCVLYELSKVVANKKPTTLARVLFTILELGSFAYFIYVAHNKADVYAYLAIVSIFIFLFIGINGLSFTSYLWNPKWTKPLGTMSTLIVVSHYYWVYYLKKLLGKNFMFTPQVLWYVLAVALTCVVVYILGVLLKKLCAKLSKVKLWKKPEENENGDTHGQSVQ